MRTKPTDTELFDGYILLLAAAFRLAIRDSQRGDRGAKRFIRDCAPWLDERGKLLPAFSLEDVARVKYTARCR